MPCNPAAANGVLSTTMYRLSLGMLWAVLLAHAPCAAAQQSIRGRYYPEKREFLVGEPIVIDLEIANHSHVAGQIGESGCEDLYPSPFEMNGVARRKENTRPHCGREAISTVCPVGGSEIPPGGKYIKRLFLNGPYVLNSPGTYSVRATSEQDIARSGGGEILAHLRIESEFEVTLFAPREGQLEAAYKPILNDLRRKDIDIRYFAAEAITQNPPTFAEAAISTLATDQITGALGVEGLGRLGTPTARKRLIDLASTGSEWIRQPAIQALGDLGNPDDCQALLEIGKLNEHYTQGEAYMFAGRVCRERAIPMLVPLLSNANTELSNYLAWALQNTQSRNAIAPLIGLLKNPDRNVRRNAADGLATLTHRKSQYGIDDANSSNEARSEWVTWWETNRDTATIFDPDDCADPQSLT
jgi:HEAT repeats